ncbi:bifunctional MaoC family dehydratase N-terminal/OB-fold nucleic acid binding domain-containing protein [Actinokineospora xionganensis]|uniref:OB-fold domain-containing protein n=1 Tax=Actinokineospora xionganensis TaxID=2684470 RepID=A0ABR7L6G5_9PSEU|nr:bifunctional MaoC family dehydratase N-terminal/OB-fold nucleic acid binding domain-containing protein [Actinokineospora xionganensis]MBC6448291.1 OB-fold domain-containing protein [Actinokineospora xionganensis]
MIRDVADQVIARGESSRRAAPDPVNVPMVRHWVEALGDRNPIYTDPVAAAASVHGGLVAPPAMVQVWTMFGLRCTRPADDPLGAMMSVLDEAGFTSVVATNCEQTYHRYLRPGEEVTVGARLTDVVGPKRTALGDGWFVTTVSTWYVGDEPVAEMLFRVLKFRPPAEEPVGDVLRPVVSLDTEFFWAGTRVGELRIQKCLACGEVRHPPGPMCPGCGSTELTHVVADGVGEIYSYVVHHHPPMPGKRLPFVVALVELAEGVRLLAELIDADPAEVRVGLPVRVDFQRIDDELTLPVWRVRS